LVADWGFRATLGFGLEVFAGYGGLLMIIAEILGLDTKYPPPYIKNLTTLKQYIM
jgi:hypothetical protein